MAITTATAEMKSRRKHWVDFPVTISPPRSVFISSGIKKIHRKKRYLKKNINKL